MKSMMLVHKIVRLIETQGAIGDGALLADDYSRAVVNANARLETIDAAVSTHQIGEAVRQMDQEPAIIDEINTLDFMRLKDWTALCQNNGWTVPPDIDRLLLEKILVSVNDRREALDPVLGMYRKSRLNKNDRLAWQSLRRLVELDPAGDWRRELLSVEPGIQRAMMASFAAARQSGDGDEAERLASELVTTKWADAGAFRGLETARAFIASREAMRRGVKAGEDIGLLKDALAGAWKLSLVETVLAELDGLVCAGWHPGVVEEQTIESARKRCQEEKAAAEFERTWTSAMSELRSALESDDLGRIDKALRAEAFGRREPDEDVVNRASDVIGRIMVARKRKRVLVASGSVAALVIVVVVSAVGISHDQLEKRTAAEYHHLAALVKSPQAAQNVLDEIKRLEREDPQVFADGRFRVIEAEAKSRLSETQERRTARDRSMEELRMLKQGGWSAAEKVIRTAFDNAAELVAVNDEVIRLEYKNLEADWQSHCASVVAAEKAAAKRDRDGVIAKCNALVQTLGASYPTPEHVEAVRRLYAECDAWREAHPDAELAPKLREAEDRVRRAAERQQELKSAVEALALADDAPTIVRARTKITSNFSDYDVVAGIGALPYSGGDVSALLAGELAGQTLLARAFKFGMGDQEFHEYLQNRVVAPLKSDAFSGMYGLSLPYGKTYVAIARGRPMTSRVGNMFIVTKKTDNGAILLSTKKEMADEYRGRENVKVELMPVSEEALSLMLKASKSSFSRENFESELLDLVDGHVAAAHGMSFVRDEIEEGGIWQDLKVGRYPALLRLRMTAIYMNWLVETGLMPGDEELVSYAKKAKTLAQKSVHAGDVPDELIWGCMFEGRVRNYNTECAQFLRQIPRDWADRYRKCRADYHRVSSVLKWKVLSAGKLGYLPTNKAWRENRKSVFPKVLPAIPEDAPLYVLRSEDDGLVLQKALVPGGNRTWRLAPSMAGSLLAGEPLFLVKSSDGRALDVRQELQSLLKDVPSGLRKRFEDRRCLWRKEVK